METILIAVLSSIVILLVGFLVMSRSKNGISNIKKNGKKNSKDKETGIKLVEKLPMEFSKKILIASYAIAIVVIIYTMYIVYMMVVGDYTGDPTSLNTLILLTLGELAGANSFYFWKAKAENLSKLNSIHDKGREITEEDIV
jgi:ABC-type Na+ efflux pump permease subunit